MNLEPAKKLQEILEDAGYETDSESFNQETVRQNEIIVERACDTCSYLDREDREVSGTFAGSPVYSGRRKCKRFPNQEYQNKSHWCYEWDKYIP